MFLSIVFSIPNIFGQGQWTGRGFFYGANSAYSGLRSLYDMSRKS